MIKEINIQNLTDSLCAGLKLHIFTLHNLIQQRKEFYKDDIFYNNERFFQYLSITSLVQDFKCKIALDYGIACMDGKKKKVDLQMLDASGKPILVAEYKKWWSSTGQIEIPSFESDIQWLKRFDPSIQKMFVVFTIHLKSDRNDNFEWLSEKLGFTQSQRYHNGFDLDSERCFDIYSFQIK